MLTRKFFEETSSDHKKNCRWSVGLRNLSGHHWAAPGPVGDDVDEAEVEAWEDDEQAADAQVRSGSYDAAFH